VKIHIICSSWRIGWEAQRRKTLARKFEVRKVLQPERGKVVLFGGGDGQVMIHSEPKSVGIGFLTFVSFLPGTEEELRDMVERFDGSWAGEG
jgi:hypothetical protein